MKQKIKKVFVFATILLFLTGCSTQLKTSDNKLVKNDLTGQTLTGNILCKPSADETIRKYEETYNNSKASLDLKKANNEITESDYNKNLSKLVDISKLPTCSSFSITDGGYDGLWDTIFVKPLAFFIIKIGELVKNYGLAVILITILIRLILYPITAKTALQSEKMKEVKPELAKIEKKYKDKTDQPSMMAKSQETMVLYKKYGINPISGCIFAVIQIPLFFAFYEALNRLPVMFEGKFLGLSLGKTVWTAIAAGEYYYIIIVILVVASTYFSIKLNKTATVDPEQAKTMNMMMNMMIVMISFASFTISTGITLYWIANSGFTIIQNLLVKRSSKDVKVI